MLYSEAWQDHTNILIFIIFIFTLINLHFLLLKKTQKTEKTIRLTANQQCWCYPESKPVCQLRVGLKVLTCGGWKERHRFSFFSIIVDRQVPDARVHVLNKTCVVSGDGYQAPLHGCRPLHTSEILHQEPSPVQEFYKVKLQIPRN